MVTHQEILELAHSIWEQEGHPEGKDTEHYFQAKKMLEEREAGQSPVENRQPSMDKKESAQPVTPKGRRRKAQ